MFGQCLVLMGIRMKLQGMLNFDMRMLLADLLVLFWAIRLLVHLIHRKLAQKTEDRRFVRMEFFLKRKIGRLGYLLLLPIRYVLSALITTVIALPILLINMVPTPVTTVVFYIGMALFVIGICIAIAADFQLMTFRVAREMDLT